MGRHPTANLEKAVELLDGLLSRSADLTVPLLKMNPTWEKLRADPAFQQLVAKYENRA